MVLYMVWNWAERMQSPAGWWALFCLLAGIISTPEAQLREFIPTNIYIDVRTLLMHKVHSLTEFFTHRPISMLYFNSLQRAKKFIVSFCCQTRPNPKVLKKNRYVIRNWMEPNCLAPKRSRRNSRRQNCGAQMSSCVHFLIKNHLKSWTTEIQLSNYKYNRSLPNVIIIIIIISDIVQMSCTLCRNRKLQSTGSTERTTRSSRLFCVAFYARQHIVLSA